MAYPNQPKYGGQGNPRREYNNANNQRQEIDPKFFEASGNFYQGLKFQARWITEGADLSMITFAEDAGHYLVVKQLGTSKFRNFYGEVKRIQMAKWENEKTSYYLLKPKLAYAVGREQNSKVQDGLKLLQLIFNDCFELVSSDKTYKNLCDLMEAILAFHKSFGGQDK